MVVETLADVAEIIMGQSPPGSTVSAEGEIPLLNGPTEFGPSHPKPTQYTSENRKIALPGDLLFCVRGSTTGRMNWADQRYAIGRGVAAIRHRTDPALQPLLRAVLEHELPELLAQATGSTFANVSAHQLASLPWPQMSLRDQYAIAKILGILDDRIKVNRLMSETSENIAISLYKSWFIDFDPVRAKAKGRDSTLSMSISDLFPNRLVDSGIGPIPEGWYVKSLDELAAFVNGLALQKYPPGAGRVLPIVKIAQLRSGSLRGADLASADLDAKYLVKDGDLLFSWSGSLECRFWSGGSGALNQHLFKVIPTGTPKWLCYCSIRSHLNSFRAIAAGKATTMGHIQRHHLSDARIAVPPQDVMQPFDTLLSPLLDRHIASALDANHLASLREALLPRFISGHLQVSSYHGSSMTSGYPHPARRPIGSNLSFKLV